MEALNILSKYHKDTTKESYVWANTENRTNWSLSKSTDRFNPRNTNSPGRSTRSMLGAIHSMIDNNLIPNNFSVLDIFCGTGAALYIIKQNFPDCSIVGADLLNHTSWGEITSIYPDSKFYTLDYFELEQDPTPLNLDLIVTFNTFRGWDNEVGPGTTKSYTKTQFSNWVKNNSNYFITDRGNVENYFQMLPFETPLDNLKVAYSR